MKSIKAIFVAMFVMMAFVAPVMGASSHAEVVVGDCTVVGTGSAYDSYVGSTSTTVDISAQGGSVDLAMYSGLNNGIVYSGAQIGTDANGAIVNTNTQANSYSYDGYWYGYETLQTSTTINTDVEKGLQDIVVESTASYDDVTSMAVMNIDAEKVVVSVDTMGRIGGYYYWYNHAIVTVNLDATMEYSDMTLVSETSASDDAVGTVTILNADAQELTGTVVSHAYAPYGTTSAGWIVNTLDGILGGFAFATQYNWFD